MTNINDIIKELTYIASFAYGKGSGDDGYHVDYFEVKDGNKWYSVIVKEINDPTK